MRSRWISVVKCIIFFGIGIANFWKANFWKAPNEPNKSEEKLRVGNQWGLGTSYGIFTLCIHAQSGLSN